MTATDELRALLDERGVEWGETDTYRLLVTSWNDASGHSWVFMEHRDGSFSKLTAYHLTPAQAIAATLGRGTCTMAHEDGNDTWWSCNECDADVYLPTRPKFCWNCGREVVDG